MMINCLIHQTYPGTRLNTTAVYFLMKPVYFLKRLAQKLILMFIFHT